MDFNDNSCEGIMRERFNRTNIFPLLLCKKRSNMNYLIVIIKLYFSFETFNDHQNKSET